MVQAEALRAWVAAVFGSLGVSEADARTTAENLVASDVRGIESHGVARLDGYTERVRSGRTVAHAAPVVLHETPSTATVDAGNGLGQPASKFAMALAISKARQTGHGSVAVRNSNHFGIAGHWAMMALPHDMIGQAYTNSSPLLVPTGARVAVTGTNPIAFAVPALRERPWVLDMATTVVPRGKLEVYRRKGLPLPLGWAVDASGQPSEDAAAILESMDRRAGGGILPLGGTGLFSGYKGYNLSVMVDILSGVLAGSGWGVHVDGLHGSENEPAGTGHFFSATRIDGFRPAEEFKAEMDAYIQMLRETPRAEGVERIWVAGEKEWDLTDQHERDGVPLYYKVIENLRAIGADIGPRFDLV